jgi:hypothetical protein
VAVVQYKFIHKFNSLPLLFKALLHGQKDLIFFCGHLIYILKRALLERLGRHGTFKSRALWSVRDGKGLNVMNPFLQYSLYPNLHIVLVVYATSDVSYICLTSDAVGDQQRANDHKR